MRAFCSLSVLLDGAAPASRIRRAEPATHFVPAGFVGNVATIFGVPDSASTEARDGRRVYRIPPDGVLRTQFATTYGWSSPAFFCVAVAETVAVAIPYGPTGSIDDTPENRADSRVEVFAYRTGTTAAPVRGKPGSFSSDAPCSVKFASSFVGTRAQYLDHARHFDIAEYLEVNPVWCAEAAGVPRFD